MEIVESACEAPFRAIIQNAGLSPDALLEKFNNGPEPTLPTIGYDVISETFTDLIAAGVVDPTKVTRTALEKAVSVAGTLLTTECMVVVEKSGDEQKS